MGEIKSPHKLLEVLLTYVVCVTYDVLEESTDEATMLIGASWGRVINDIAKEKGMTRKEVFFQAEDGIRDLVRSRGLGDVYKRQINDSAPGCADQHGCFIGAFF